MTGVFEVDSGYEEEEEEKAREGLGTRKLKSFSLNFLVSFSFNIK